MLHLKQTLHKSLEMISETTSQLKQDFILLGRALRNLLSVASYGVMLSSLKLLIHILLSLGLTCILSLSWLMKWMWTKLLKLWTSTNLPELSVQVTVWPWVGATKSTKTMQKQSPSSQWEEDGDIPQDSTSTYSEIRGGLKESDIEKIRHSGI